MGLDGLVDWMWTSRLDGDETSTRWGLDGNGSSRMDDPDGMGWTTG